MDEWAEIKNILDSHEDEYHLYEQRFKMKRPEAYAMMQRRLGLPDGIFEDLKKPKRINDETERLS